MPKFKVDDLVYWVGDVPHFKAYKLEADTEREGWLTLLGCEDPTLRINSDGVRPPVSLNVQQVFHASSSNQRSLDGLYEGATFKDYIDPVAMRVKHIIENEGFAVCYASDSPLDKLDPDWLCPRTELVFIYKIKNGEFYDTQGEDFKYVHLINPFTLKPAKIVEEYLKRPAPQGE